MSFVSKATSPDALTKENTEGWPPLTVESEVNGDSKRTNERGPFLVGRSFSITNIFANSKPKSERLEM
jgi:hypothetical protein